MFRTAVVAIAAFLVTAAAADAHPLGNFTVNHLTRITSSGGRLDLAYTVDMAEIPSYAALRALDPQARPTANALNSWAQSTSATVLSQMQLTIDGKNVTPSLASAHATSFAGAGGLRTLYLQAHFTAPLGPGAHRIAYIDGYAHDRIGWRGVALGSASDPTSALRAYPPQLLGSPRDTTTANAAVSSTGAIAALDTPAASASTAVSDSPGLSRDEAFSFGAVFNRGFGSPLVIVIALVLSIFLGALHAFEPGHGKTLLAVSLVGARASVKQAVILATALTVAHTGGVIMIGAAFLLFAQWLAPQLVYTWLGLIAALFVLAIAAPALARQVALRRKQEHVHTHTHDRAHPHDHAHDHAQGDHHHHDDLDDLEHAKLHAIPGTAPLTFRTAVSAAMVGNVAPCPAALVVLFLAVQAHQVAWGMTLIVAFGLGLAMVLTGLGIAVVRSASWLSSKPQFARVAQVGPLVTACLITIIGAVMLANAVGQFGVTTPMPVLAAIVCVAVAGYALTRASHGHGAHGHGAHDHHTHGAHA